LIITHGDHAKTKEEADELILFEKVCFKGTQGVQEPENVPE
jgi:hypothetical protein